MSGVRAAAPASARGRLAALSLLAFAVVFAVLAVPRGAAQDTVPCVDADNGRCDLAIVSATASMPTVDTVHVDVAVSNIGGDGSFETTMTIDGGSEWPPFEARIKALAPGERQDVPADFDIPSSARGKTAVFSVQVVPVPGEGDAGPNSARAAVRIPPAVEQRPPDLMPVNVGARLLDGGARVEVFGDVRNLGDVNTGSVTVTVSAPGWDSADVTLGGVARRTSESFAASLDTPEDQRGASVRFHVTVTPVDGEEQTENNDADTAPIEIPTTGGNGGNENEPDLVLARATAQSIEAGQRVAVSGTVENRGDPTSEDLQITVGAAGWQTKSGTLAGGIARGASRTFKLRLDVPDEARGQETLFQAGVTPVEGERNVANNARTTSAIVIPLVADTDDWVDDIPWPLVLVGAAALVLLLALLTLRSRRKRRRLGRPRREPKPEPEPKDEPLYEPLPERAVSTGFASEWGPAYPLDPDVPLATATKYVFWLEIGPPLTASIEETPTDLPAGVPAGAKLTVAVFGLDGALAVLPGTEVGELRLAPDGSVGVVRPAADVGAIESGLQDRRLFFHVQTGDAPGTGRLRCNIYYDQVLLQSRLVTAVVRPDAERQDGALRSTLDYTLAPSLDPAQLAELKPHRLSVLVNESADGSHDFYFLGEREFKNGASFDGQELQNLIERARGALRRAAWGDDEEWTSSKSYRYEGFDLERLQIDLTQFARSGYRFYDAIVNRLAGGYDGAAPLAELMVRPGLVQIASRESPRHVIPAALIYDYPLDTTAAVADYTLCPAFADALVQERPLGELACLRGECPSRSEPTVVCPSGFWGYRHALGLPVSVGRTALDVPGEIGYTQGPHLAVAVSTDPGFVLRAEHEKRLRALRAGLEWHYADSRAKALALLKQGGAEVVYFYCHGGVADDVPFIQVGPTSESTITRDLLRREGIRWTAPRPLVFVNGCHTTALEPEKAIEFVSALVENTQASGVIGTEITVFEPLASTFAEECLRRFLDGAPIGEAVRDARLALLAQGNPLGLAYIPFATASLRLRAATSA